MVNIFYGLNVITQLYLASYNLKWNISTTAPLKSTYNITNIMSRLSRIIFIRTQLYRAS